MSEYQEWEAADVDAADKVKRDYECRAPMENRVVAAISVERG